MRILVVDDEKEIADYVRELVDEVTMNLAETEVFYSGSKALQRIKEVTFELVITDMVMPVTDGLQILEYIAEHARDTEVIFLSGHKKFDYIYKANRLKPVNYIVKTEDVKTIKRMFEQVIGEIKNRRKENLQSTAQKNQQEEIEKQSEEAMVESICNYVSNNLSVDFNISQIAEIFHYNAAYLSRIFKNHKGYKLSNYILEQKMKKAKSYLAETDYPIAKIAKLVGYQSPQAFSRVFRKEEKKTPQVYRRLYRKSIGDDMKV